MLGRPDHPDEGLSGVDADPGRRPWRIGVVAGGPHELAGGEDRIASVVAVGQGRDEDADDLIAGELVNDRVVVDQGCACGGIEPIHARAELG